jgi:hypothetical protein
MNSAGAAQPHGDATPSRYFDLTLIGIALVCLIPKMLFATSQFVEYDGYWHVWIAQQDRWANFIREYQTNAHPPLYFLLLRMTFWLGRTQLAYRSISLISGTASVYVLGRTAMKAMRSPVWAALSALAYGLALPSILLSNEVRTYMLSAFLVQVSFYYFLDLTAPEQPVSLRPRVLFAVTASLACLTEYYALIYVGATLLFALALPVVRRDAQVWRSLFRETTTFAAILALPVWEYISHFGARSVAYDHLPAYYFEPDSAESAVEFLLRNLRNELNWFSPWQIPEGLIFWLTIGLLLAVAAVIVYLLRKWRLPRNLPALVSLLLPLVMTIAIMVGALLRAYPFGGFLRQQFILFPFLAVCPFLLPDRLLTTAPRTASFALAGLLAIGVSWANIENYIEWPKVSQLLLTDQMERYNRLFPSAQAIYIDQFNLTTFFMHHHDWKWDFVSPLPGSATVDVYKVSRGNRSFLLFRDTDHWILDLREPQLYSQMARGLRTWHLTSTTIFCLAQPGVKTRTAAQVTAYRGRIAELTAAENLCVERLDLDNYDVYAEFRNRGLCTATPEDPQ